MMRRLLPLLLLGAGLPKPHVCYLRIESEEAKDEVAARFQELEKGLEHWSRINNVLVNGYPEDEGEDALQTAIEIGHRLGVKTPLEQIERAYRVQCKRKPRPLVIQLHTKEMKMNWILTYRAKKLWTQRWYMAEHLPRLNRNLEINVREWAKAKNYSSVWTWNARVFYKKNNSQDRYRVINEVHLMHLKSEDEPRFEVTEKPKPEVIDKINIFAHKEERSEKDQKLEAQKFDNINFGKD